MSASLSEGLQEHGGMFLGRWEAWSAMTAGKRRGLALYLHAPVVQSDVTTLKSLTASVLGVHAPSRLRSSQLGLLHASVTFCAVSIHLTIKNTRKVISAGTLVGCWKSACH